jgi:sodium/potassium/calcium exchanger 6
MPHAKPVAFLILVSWLGLLFSTIGIAASDFFCINLSTIATILGMSESMAGVTFLAFGNGSPDVFSTFAAFSTNSSSLAIGELFGAAGFITAVVAGSMALVRPFRVARKAFVRDVGFFTVAAAFSLSFLWDGRLHLWECITMVLFYVFYVAFVVVWHWWMGVRRRRRERNAAARGHFLVPGSEEIEAEENYHDGDDEESTTHPSFSRGPSVDDFSVLEGGGTPTIVEPYEDEDDDEARDRWLGELKSNMRLTRPGPGSRRNTLTPIRPSLVGALEFQAVLKSLQKSRSHQTIPMHSRRYSDDPTFTTAQQQEEMSGESDPASRPPFHPTDEGTSPALERPSLDIFKNKSGRTRAVSANDAAHLRSVVCRLEALIDRPLPKLLFPTLMVISGIHGTSLIWGRPQRLRTVDTVLRALSVCQQSTSRMKRQRYHLADPATAVPATRPVPLAKTFTTSRFQQAVTFRQTLQRPLLLSQRMTSLRPPAAVDRLVCIFPLQVSLSLLVL